MCELTVPSESHLNGALNMIRMLIHSDAGDKSRGCLTRMIALIAFLITFIGSIANRHADEDESLSCIINPQTVALSGDSRLVGYFRGVLKLKSVKLFNLLSL